MPKNTGNRHTYMYTAFRHTYKYMLLDSVNIFISHFHSAQRPEEERKGPTWIHNTFQGILVNETQCLCCETVRSREEEFLDLSLDIEQNTSLTHCLRSV